MRLLAYKVALRTAMTGVCERVQVMTVMTFRDLTSDTVIYSYQVLSWKVIVSALLPLRTNCHALSVCVGMLDF